MGPKAKAKANGCMSFISSVIIGGFLGTVIGMPVLSFLDITFINQGNADAGQLGALGPFIGGPIGMCLGLLLAVLKGRWRSALAGALFGAMLCVVILFAKGKEIPYLWIGLVIGGGCGAILGWFLPTGKCAKPDTQDSEKSGGMGR